MAANSKTEKLDQARLSQEHKQALARGREQGSIVRRYLEAVDSSKSRRRHRIKDPEKIKNALVEVEGKLLGATALTKLQLIQQKRELLAELKKSEPKRPPSNDSLEEDFIKVASDYGKRKGISYGTWRDAGVPIEVLKKAGISRTRG